MDLYGFIYALVRLWGITSIVTGAAGVAGAVVFAVIFGQGDPETAGGIAYYLLCYGVAGIVGGIALLAFSEPITKFACNHRPGG